MYIQGSKRVLVNETKTKYMISLDRLGEIKGEYVSVNIMLKK